MTSKKRLYSFLFASSLGTFLEFFDLALYSFCAPLIAKQFFPQGDPLVAILATWGIFAISYLMRPLGAIWFGHLADARSSKQAMLISMAMMSFATIAIGVLPTYEMIGVWAPVSLLAMRLLQSIAVSPEYNLPSVFMKNNAWFAKRFGLVSSMSAVVTGLGMMSASWVMAHMLGDGNYYQWRSPFIIAGFLVGTIGLFLRLNVDDNILSKRPAVVPLQSVFKKQPRDFLFGVFLSGYVGCISYALFSFLVHQLQYVKQLSMGNALAVLSAGSLLPSGFSLIAGFLSDKYPRKYLMVIAALVMGAVGFVLFLNMSALDIKVITILSCVMLASLGFFAGSFPGFLAELYQQEYRYTGSFLSYNMGMSWIGGVSPILFITCYGFDYRLPSYIILGYSLAVIVFMERTLCRALITVVVNLLTLRGLRGLVSQPK